MLGSLFLKFYIIVFVAMVMVDVITFVKILIG